MEDLIRNPESVSAEEIESLLERNLMPTIQFSKPGTSPLILKAVNKLCALFGDKLDVRFYAHYSDVFDASVLKHLPDVQSLTINCLMDIVNEDEILELKRLRKFHFGVYNFDRPTFLADLDLGRLTYLGLSENKKRNFDLAPLSECENLEKLMLEGHIKNIAALSGLPKLRKLFLRMIPKRQPLDFANSLPQLRAMDISVGGRENIDELEHPGLQNLEIALVRALNSLGDLNRFPNLRRLRVRDQIRLHSISVTGTILEEIGIYNCKNLEQIDGLLELKSLRRFQSYISKLDLDALLNATWPKSMESVELYSGDQEWDDRAHEVLAGKGYKSRP
ncbi:MAG: hypothetical protein QNI99_16845 [Woeseiaceae bacterium]|nr:hypothetical protein [Woeseiaceae bacterium]